MSTEELGEIKKLLADYYFKKVEAEVDAFWEKKNFTTETWNKATRAVHLSNKKLSKRQQTQYTAAYLPDEKPIQYQI